MDYKTRKKYIDIATGKLEADLVFKRARVVDVLAEEINTCDVAISDGIIVGLGYGYHGKQEINLNGKFLVPGFIDAHLHIESTLVSPKEFLANALRCGTTTFIADPHESANVSGLDGVDYILSETESVPSNVYVMFPSCVPALSFEQNGATLTAKDMRNYINNDRILGLGEVMDYGAVISSNPEMMEKIELFENKIIDGHASGLSGKDLAGYAMAGIQTDHECTTFEEALERRRLGMTVLIREGSSARNAYKILYGLISELMCVDGFAFCTDDKHIDQIREYGHIDYIIRLANRLGMDAIRSIKMATINAAECYGLHHLGAIAVGRQADVIVLNDLASVDINSVYHKGMLVTDSTLSLMMNYKQCPDNLKHTVNIQPITKAMLELKAENKMAVAVELVDGEILTKNTKIDIPDKIFNPNKIVNKVAVIERHKATGNVGVAPLLNFGIQNGAIATTFAHDSHNLIVAGDNDEDMIRAINEVANMSGGYVLVSNGKVIGKLPLEIMGLMTNASYDEASENTKHIIEEAYKMGVNKNIDPLTTLSFISLPVIPEVRVTSKGLYDVVNNKFVTGNNPVVIK